MGKMVNFRLYAFQQKQQQKTVVEIVRKQEEQKLNTLLPPLLTTCSVPRVMGVGGTESSVQSFPLVMCFLLWEARWF